MLIAVPATVENCARGWLIAITRLFGVHVAACGTACACAPAVRAADVAPAVAGGIPKMLMVVKLPSANRIRNAPVNTSLAAEEPLKFGWSVIRAVWLTEPAAGVCAKKSPSRTEEYPMALAVTLEIVRSCEAPVRI